MPALCNRSIDNWLICISGFTQTICAPTGLHDLWLRLGHAFRGPSTSVDLFAWRADFAQVAEAIKLARGERNPRVAIFAYSWGAGRGFLDLAQQLRHRDIRVAAAVLCDPVYFSRWNPAGAILGERVIDVPDNVAEVFWTYQRTDKFPLPHGHRPVAVDMRRTLVHPGIELHGVCHNSMDDTPSFQRLAERIARETFKSPIDAAREAGL